MKLKTKKIIAREFLVLIVILLLAMLCGFGIYPYNAYRQLQIKSIEKEIRVQEKESDSLAMAYNAKRNVQKDFFSSLSSKFDVIVSDQNTTDKTWKILNEIYYNDSIPIKFDKIWDVELVNFIKSKGYHDGEAFEKFVGENLLSKNDSSNFIKSEMINRDISELNVQLIQLRLKIVNSNKQLEFSFIILIVLLLIAYPIRLLVLGIKWSVNIITQKE